MKKALLIIDIQNDYFEHGTMPLTGSFAASDNAKKVLETFYLLPARLLGFNELSHG